MPPELGLHPLPLMGSEGVEVEPVWGPAVRVQHWPLCAETLQLEPPALFPAASPSPIARGTAETQALLRGFKPSLVLPLEDAAHCVHSPGQTCRPQLPWGLRAGWRRQPENTASAPAAGVPQPRPQHLRPDSPAMLACNYPCRSRHRPQCRHAWHRPITLPVCPQSPSAPTQVTSPEEQCP